MAQTIKGTLNEISLTDLLDMLNHGSKSGVLKLKFGDARLNMTLAFHEGLICRLQSSLAAKLTDIFIDMGLSQEDIETLRQYDTETKTLQRDEDSFYPVIEKALRRRLEMALVPVLERRDGQFGFYFGSSPPLLLPGIHPISLCLDIAKRIDESKRFSSLGARLSLDDEFITEASPFIKRGQTLSEQSACVLGLFARARSLLEVSQVSRLTWDELLKVVILLWEEGYIKPITPKSLLSSHGDGVLDYS
ncbi:MAG: DUF4388 domain-containing protein [Deinococcales bacterium]